MTKILKRKSIKEKEQQGKRDDKIDVSEGKQEEEGQKERERENRTRIT